MTHELDTLKTLLQIDTSDILHDDLLTQLKAVCSAEYKARTHQEEADETIVNLMVVERFNRLGNEGVSTMNYSGITESYESDYSEMVQKLIRSNAKMVML